MYNRFCFTLTILLSLGHSCAAQNSLKSLDRIANNEELKYVLTHLEPSEITFASDEKRHFFVKAYKVRGHNSVRINMEETVQKEYYYFIVSSFDEATHIDAQLFKSQEFVNPIISRIIDSENGKAFLIYMAISESEEEDTNSSKVEHKERNRKIIFKINKF